MNGGIHLSSHHWWSEIPIVFVNLLPHARHPAENCDIALTGQGRVRNDRDGHYCSYRS